MRGNGAIVDDQGKLNNFAIEPKMYVQENPRLGFTPYAEEINGRLAMIGFVSLLAIEAVSGHGLMGVVISSWLRLTRRRGDTGTRRNCLHITNWF